MVKSIYTNNRCYLCEKPVARLGLLFYCRESTCGCVFWDDLVKKEIKLVKRNYSLDKNLLLTLKDAGVPYRNKVPYRDNKRDHYFVYVIDFGGLPKTAASKPAVPDIVAVAIQRLMISIESSNGLTIATLGNSEILSIQLSGRVPTAAQCSLTKTLTPVGTLFDNISTAYN